MLEKWNKYETGNVKFIENNRSHLYHKLYVDYIKDNPDIEHVIEIGPGEMVEYPEIRKIRPSIKYDVLETSKSFIEFINNMYPEITIWKGIIETFINPTVEYDLVRICDVIEHTFPVSKTIKNIIMCAKKFHITMFKWKTGKDGTENEPDINSSSIREDSNGDKYFSSEFPVLDIIKEIKKYGDIESMVVVKDDTNEVVKFDDYWINNFYSDKNPELSTRGHRLVITGTRKAVRQDIVDNEMGPEMYDEHWSNNLGYITEHPYVKPMIEMIRESKHQPKNVLEVGAGFGFAAKRIIDNFSPETYFAYEFSNAIFHLHGILISLKNECEVFLIKESFKNIEDVERFDCVVAMEIFEHINWDLEFIGKIKPGTKVFFSVPTKPGKFHVRHFENVNEITNRYGGLLDIKNIIYVPNKWWCVDCTRNEKI